MKRTVTLVLAGSLLGATLVGCGGSKRQVQTIRVPPRVDLRQHETIGIVQFDSAAKGELAPMATRRFTESARRDQGLVRMVDFRSSKELLDSVGEQRWSPEACRAIGEEYGVRTILTGELNVSEVKPSVRLAPSLRSGSLTAKIEATLSVQMIETDTGASIWSTSARASQDVGHVSVFGGKDLVFDADDPDQAYGGLIETLVEQVTRDFHVSWERR